MHEFCEENAIPCLFPNVEVPVVAERDFYPMYFSKGVLLEAQLIARTILGPDNHPSAGAVEQVYRAGDSGEPAAEALAAELEGHGVTVHSTVLRRGCAGAAVTAALRTAALRKGARGQALVLWLRPADIAALGDVPAGAGHGLPVRTHGWARESPLPAGWREHALMTYPFDLPEKRGVRLDYPLGWFSFRHIPLVAEQVQTDTYLACSLLADVLNRMADNFVRPYLVEQLQGPARAPAHHRLLPAPDARPQSAIRIQGRIPRAFPRPRRHGPGRRGRLDCAMTAGHAGPVRPGRTLTIFAATRAMILQSHPRLRPHKRRPMTVTRAKCGRELSLSHAPSLATRSPSHDRAIASSPSP